MKNRFIFILRRRSAREPGSIVCEDEQDDPFYSAGPHRNLALAKANTWKTQERYGKNEDEWTRKVEFIKEEIVGSRRSMQRYILT